LNNLLYETKEKMQEGGMRMIVYTGENEVKLVQSVASASTLISSLTGEIKEYIISKFPKNLFKSVYIDTAETVTAQNRNAKFNSNLNKIQYPNLSITPQISLDNPIEGTEKSPHQSSPNLYLRTNMREAYRKLMVDPAKKVQMYYTNDYITTNFNFRITMNKFIQNVDMAHYIKSNFQMGFFQFLNGRYLNTEIPKSFIKIIGGALNYDINDAEQRDALRMYLISTSRGEDYVKMKTNLSTGKVGFFVNERANFLVLVTDLDAPGSITRDQMSEGEYVINFRVQVSAWLPNAFIMSVNRDLYLSLNGELIAEVTNPETTQIDDGIYSLTLFSVRLDKKDAIYFRNSQNQTVIGELAYHEVFTFDITRPLDEIFFVDLVAGGL
jgi:hypothetical protein